MQGNRFIFVLRFCIIGENKRQEERSVMDNKAIGSFIAQERRAKQLTQVDFAEKLHVSAKTVSKWENGNGLPHTDLLFDICSILDITLNELLCGKRLDQEMEKIETRKNILKTVITKRELETLSILTEILICVGIVISITLTSVLAKTVLQIVITQIVGAFVWGYGLFLRIKIRKILNAIRKVEKSE